MSTTTTFSQTDPYVPLGFCQVWGRALSLFRERKDLFLLIALLRYIPDVFLLSTFPHPTTAIDTAFDATSATADVDSSAAADDDNGGGNNSNNNNAEQYDGDAAQLNDPQELFGYFAQFQLTLFIMILIGIMAKAAIVVAVAVLYNRAHPELGWCAQQVVRRACGLFCAFLCTIFGGALSIGLTLPIVILLWISQNVILRIIAVLVGLVLVGAYLYLILSISMLVPSVMIEHKGPIQGVKRSIQLLAKDFCLVFGTTFLLTLTGSGIAYTMTKLPIDGLVGAAVKTLPSIFFVPFDAILTTVVYFNIRITREGLDKDGLAQEVQFGTSHDPLADDGDVEVNKVDMGDSAKLV